MLRLYRFPKSQVYVVVLFVVEMDPECNMRLSVPTTRYTSTVPGRIASVV